MQCDRWARSCGSDHMVEPNYSKAFLLHATVKHLSHLLHLFSSFSFSSQHFLTPCLSSHPSLNHPLIPSITSPFPPPLSSSSSSSSCTIAIAAVTWQQMSSLLHLLDITSNFLKTGTILRAARVHVFSNDGIFAVAVKLEATRRLFYFPQADCLQLNCIFLEGPAPCATQGPFINYTCRRSAVFLSLVLGNWKA